MAELIRTPEIVNAIRTAIARAFKQAAPIVQRYAVANVSGRILKRGTGQLASSIYTRVTRTRTGGNLRVGTPVFYGRIWERGRKGSGVWYHKKKGFAKRRSVGTPIRARPFLRPAAEQAIPEIIQRIDLELDRELKAAFDKTITIDLKLT